MTTISDKDRAEAQAMFGVYHGRVSLGALSDNFIPRWLAVRDHVLAAHECPTVPVWRPTTADEIEPGWEIRSRRRDGFEMNWGTAHHQDEGGDWRTEAGALLTSDSMRWTHETTAPLPEPEPWDEELVGVVGDAIGMAPGDHTSWQTARAVLDLLAARGLLDRGCHHEGRAVVSAQAFRCCPHCADDQPHIEKDTHELPCTLCYGDMERHTAAIAEKAREWRDTLDPSASMADHVAAGDALIAAVDAERVEREGKP